MKNEIHFRPIKKSDYTPLQKIISKTWGYEKFCSPKTAGRMAKLYLLGCLMEQTFTCVAEKAGTAVGIIMCQSKNRNHNRFRLKYAFTMFLSGIAMVCTKEGRKVVKMFGKFEAIDKDLLKESGQEFDGQLAFFAVGADVRGTGIGKALWDRGVSYLKEQGVQNFYLYTDTTCNFGFYEHKGMGRICEKTISLKPHFDNGMQFYLYRYQALK